MNESVIDLWYSPVVGAYLIWRFTTAYCNLVPAGPNLLLIFPALAVLTSPRLSAPIKELHIQTFDQYVDHFLDSGGTKSVKSLAGIHRRIEDRKGWILRSIETAISTDIVKLDAETGCLNAPLNEETKDMKRAAPRFKKDYGLRAEKLGEWFATTAPDAITDFLGVNF